MISFTIFLYCVMVVAAQNDDLPTVVPTFTPTATLLPTAAPTRAPIPAPVPIRPCYSNLTEIEHLVSLKDPFIVETYILCPDTIYTMGSFDPITEISIDGWKPIFTRANSIFQCGEDGKSSNNCILTGGAVQIFHEVVTFNREDKNNVVIKGITFEDAKTGGVVLAAPGDITLIDCIFRNHQNVGAIQLLYCAACSGLRRLKTIVATVSHANNYNPLMTYYGDVVSNSKSLAMSERDASRSRSRLLPEEEVAKTQKVTLDGCLFENNSRGSKNIATFNGMINIVTTDNDITIKNSIFRNNNFASQENASDDGYAIANVEGSKVTISDTCFTNNFFSGKGVVVFEGSEADFNANNVFGEIDDKLLCAFARIGDETCIDYDSATCTALTSFGADSTTTAEDSAKTVGMPGDGSNTSGSFAVSSFAVRVGFSFLLVFPAFMGL